MASGKIELPEIAKRQALLDDPRTAEWANGSLERTVQLRKWREQLAKEKAAREATLLSWADKKLGKWLEFRENGKIADLRMGVGEAGPVREFGVQSVDDVIGREYGLGLDYDTIDWLEIQKNILSYCGENKMLWEFEELLAHYLRGDSIASFKLTMPYRDGGKQTLLSVGAPAVRSAQSHLGRFRMYVARDIERKIMEKGS